MDKLLSGKAE